MFVWNDENIYGLFNCEKAILFFESEEVIEGKVC